MALINGQTCLENIALEHRPTLLKKNEYKNNEEYDVNHPNAIGDGDGRGRGTKSGGHTHSTPDCADAEYIGEHFQSPINQQIDTNIEPNEEGIVGGDCVDINGRFGLDNSGRMALIRINNYNHINSYGPHSVKTELNVEGDILQYRVELRDKMNIKCNE